MSKTLSVDSLLEGSASLKTEQQNEELKYVKLGELCISITRGITISPDTLMFYMSDLPSDKIYIGPGSYKDHELDFWNTPFLGKFLKEWEKGRVEAGDLLLSKTITPPKAFVMDFPKSARVVASSNLFIVKLDKSKIDPVYLMAYLNTEEGQEQLKEKGAGEKRTKAIPIDSIKDIDIPVLPMSDQLLLASKFSDKIRNIKDLKESLEIAEWSLGDLYRDGYLPDHSTAQDVFNIMER